MGLEVVHIVVIRHSRQGDRRIFQSSFPQDYWTVSGKPGCQVWVLIFTRISLRPLKMNETVNSLTYLTRRSLAVVTLYKRLSGGMVLDGPQGHEA